jgi:thiol-disulfide isomerase/thioredoxin
MQTRMSEGSALRITMALLLGSLLCGSAAAAPAAGVAPGKKAPGFNLNVLNGDGDGTVRLRDLVGKRPKTPAKLVLVSFFATWCKPCKAEMPILQAIHQTLGPKGVKVLSVIVEGADDRPQKEILEEIEGWTTARGVTFPILYDPFLKDVVAKRYLGQAMQLPGVYLVGPDGTVKAAWHEKRDDLQTLIEEHLK